MTLDEAIAHAKEVARENRYRTKHVVFHRNDIAEINACTECAEEHEQLAEWLEELKRYKELKEQGRLIELPCAIGDTVYTIPRSKPRRWKVVYIGICGDGRHYMNIAWYKDHHNFETRSVYFDEIGKTVFITKDDAEAELERRSNERNNQN